MLIVLFRHGPAGSSDPERWPDDRLRPLSPRGRERTLTAAHGLDRLIPNDAKILTSPLKRALETARFLARAHGVDQVEMVDVLTPGVSQRRMFEFLAARRDAALVLVGHEPDLGALAGALIGAEALPLKKAGACAIDCEGKPGPGAGTLSWFLPPKMLRRMGRKKVRA
jgi:phosphohistidine phosphatase